MVELSDQFGSPYFTKGGQGKFFKDPKPIDEVRYPRGYTPGRMADVQTWNIRHLQNPTQPDAPFAGPGGTRRLQEVIARSKAPRSEFSRAAMMTHGISHPLKIMTGFEMNEAGLEAHGFFHPGASHEGGIIGLSHETPGEERAGQSLQHELGHYKSNKIERNLHSQYIELPEERGKEEAYADDVRRLRWRPDPRDVRAGRSNPPESPYELGAVTADEHLPEEFSSAYLHARRTPFNPTLAEHLRTIFHERRHGRPEQQSMF